MDPASLPRITPPDGLRLVDEIEKRHDENADEDVPASDEPTQPMRLSFLALLAERAPAVQRQLSERWTLALARPELSDEDRPTDPYIPVTAGK